MKISFRIILVLLAVSNALSFVSPGDLDPTFGVGGRVISSIANTDVRARGTAVQPDEKIIVVASYGSNAAGFDFFLTRLNADGVLDATFGEAGVVITDFSNDSDSARAVELQPDGKIVVAGTAKVGGQHMFALARYNTDGTLDTTFGVGGKVTTAFEGAVAPAVIGAAALEILSDGKMIAAGWAGFELGTALARYNADGSLDTSFGVGGKVVTEWLGGLSGTYDVATDSANRIVTVGYVEVPFKFELDVAVVRYLPDGSLDTSFGEGGKVLRNIDSYNEIFHSVIIQADDKIIAGGATNFESDRFLLARFNIDGSFDQTFDDDGVVLTDFPAFGSGASSIVMQPDAKIVAVGDAGPPAGYRNHIALARYNTNGSLDVSFGFDGQIVHAVAGKSGNCWNNAAALRPNGKVVAVGYADLTPPNPNNEFDLLVSRFVTNSQNVTFDHDADGKTDFSVFRPSSGAWYLQRSTAGFQGVQFGAEGDRLTPADFDGDGKTDIAVYRPSAGQWYVLNSATSTVTYPVFGVAEDVPAPGDYDGDGKADLTVFRPSQGTWYRQNSSNGTFFGMQFGATGDVPTVADFDGDGKNDLGIFRPSIGDWYNIRSSNGSVFGERFGQTGDRIAPADYDGDGKTDIAIFRPSTGLWVVRNSATSTYSYSVFGSPADVPISGDYDGDGKADIGVWRPSDGTWYVQRSSNGQFIVFPWGQNGDVPTPGAYGN